MSATRPMLRLRRVYEPPEAAGGVRILVDRLWPRGLSKGDAAVDAWVRDAAPSDALRRWYGHDPLRWEEFRRRYRAELAVNGAGALRHLERLCRAGDATLLFAAADVDRNNAVVLKEVLEEGLGGPSRALAACEDKAGHRAPQSDAPVTGKEGGER